MFSLADLQAAIEASWSSETSYAGDKLPADNPARGQCVTTALVVQHFLGGELEKATTQFDGHTESHYYNILPDGSKVDLSSKQYPAGQAFTKAAVNLHGYKSIRVKMLNEPETRYRYEVLLKRVSEKLATMVSGQPHAERG